MNQMKAGEEYGTDEMTAKTEIDFEEVLLSMPDAVLIENADHEIIWMNEAARRLLQVEIGDRSVVPVELTEAIMNDRNKLIVRKIDIGQRTFECKACAINGSYTKNYGGG